MRIRTRIRRQWRRRRGPVGIAALVLAFWVASVGVLPSTGILAKAARESAGERYPCQGGRCSCSSAYECWTACRCKSMSEKVAWAHEHGVPVPSYADLTLVSAPPSAPACPLCVTEDSAAPDAEPAPPVTLSPLGCKGLEILTAFAVPTTLRPRPTVVPGADTPKARPLAAHNLAFSSRTIDLDPPPPRAA